MHDANTGKAKPKRTPKNITVRDNVPPGARVVMKPETIKDFVGMFGEKLLRKIDGERSR